ncbi:MAG TPA: DnaD domain protein [Bacillota bacterium]|nr:DnaD domain protein [Bacillota bacterium]HOK68954.1 DnaD domain protein [Bacillota bacterium]HPP85406.1 DnaD domain protein [Bacillota bacterium]
MNQTIAARTKVKTPCEDLIILPRAVQKHLKNAGETELKVLIYLFANPDFTAGEAARELGLTVSEVEAAVAFWRGAGVVELTSAKEAKKSSANISLYQNYDSDVLSNAIEKDGEFRELCNAVGDLTERILNKNDYNSLYYLYDYVGLPADLICGIAQYCKQEKKFSMQYMMKTALGMYEEGIDTYEKLEQLLAKKEKAKTGIGMLRKLCGMGDRELSAKENEYVNNWFIRWDMPFDLIKLAYDKTVDNTGKVKFSYMNSILKCWYENGYRTAEDVAAGDKKECVESSFDADEFFEAAVKRTMNT